MPVLRSREIPSPPKPSSSKTLINGNGIFEPSTPAKLIESFCNQSHLEPTRSPNSVEFGSGSTRNTGLFRRRSLRLASMSNSGDNCSDSLGPTRKRGRSGGFIGASNGGEVEDVQVKNENDLCCLDGSRVSDFEEEKAGEVPVEVKDDGARVSDSEEEVALVEVPVDNCERSVGASRRKRAKGEAGVEKMEVRHENGYLSLRSGARLWKRMLEVSNGDMLVMEAKTEVKEEKGKGVLVEEGSQDDTSASERRMDEDDVLALSLSNTKSKGSRRFTQEEKGKGKITTDDCVFNTDDLDLVKLKLGLDYSNVDLSFPPEATQSTIEGVAMDNLASDTTYMSGNAELQGDKPNTRSSSKGDAGGAKSIMDQFKDIARRNAHKYAYFSAREEEKSDINIEVEPGEPSEQPVANIEDWPGPFSTAMKIIRDREMNLNAQVQNLSSGKGGMPLVSWSPRKERDPDWAKRAAPSLQDLCLSILAKNVDAITSLQYVPDVLRHKLSQSLCDSRRMNGHFLNLLLEGSPSEIRLADCSWLEEDKYEKSFGGCDTNNLTVLQLDLCGHCVSDSSLRCTLLQRGLSALTAISLRGACRISDAGLSELVSSARALRSINLSQCSLLTDVGINNLANSLGSVLRELYLDDCESLDALRILPALKRLKGLEVLSLRGIASVSDKFMKELIVSNGQNLKELILAHCQQLTDSSLRVIAETCSQLFVLDLSHLSKLTDIGMAHLANGCREIQDLKLCRNAFSDDAIAAFLEASGASLKELSLNNITTVGQNTTISLARRCKNLHSLDLSWCRRLTNEALGLIADSCLSLKVLKLFGCTQVTSTFLDGHSNPHLQIIGLKLTPILDSIKRPDFQQGPLHYSGVPSL